MLADFLSGLLLTFNLAFVPFMHAWVSVSAETCLSMLLSSSNACLPILPTF